MTAAATRPMAAARNQVRFLNSVYTSFKEKNRQSWGQGKPHYGLDWRGFPWVFKKLGPEKLGSDAGIGVRYQFPLEIGI